MSELKLKVENMTESKHRPRLDELCIAAYDLCTSRRLYGGFPGRRCVRAKGRIEVSQILKQGPRCRLQAMSRFSLLKPLFEPGSLRPLSGSDPQIFRSEIAAFQGLFRGS